MPDAIVQSVIASSPLAGVLLLMWWLERKDRLEKEKRAYDLTERSLAGLNAATKAIEELKNALLKTSQT